MTVRLPLSPTTRAFVALCIAIASLGIAACFSERTTATNVVSTANCSIPASAAGTTVVFITGFVFQPASVHVKSGEKVTWVNCEPTNIPHTSTSDASGWNSGLLNPGQSFIQTFTSAGAFPYHCGVHLSMKGTVIVD